MLQQRLGVPAKNYGGSLETESRPSDINLVTVLALFFAFTCRKRYSSWHGERSQLDFQAPRTAAAGALNVGNKLNLCSSAGNIRPLGGTLAGNRRLAVRRRRD